MNRAPQCWMLLLVCLAPVSAQAADRAPDAANDAETGFSHYTLTNGYADWDSAYFDAGHRFARHHSVYGELRQARRFGLTDRELSGGYYYPVSPRWIVLVEASASPEHHFLPKHSAHGQLQVSFAGGWDIQGGIRRAWYTQTPTDIATLTGERYWGRYRAAYTLYLARLPNSGTAPSHKATLSYYYTDHSNLTLTLARGRQLQSLGPSLGVLLLDVRSISIGGRHWITPAWGITYMALSERQGNLYSRKGIRIGLRYAF